MATKNLHALAQGRAKQRVINQHREEYQRYYLEECQAMGLRNHPTRAQRIEKIREELRKLEAGV